MLATLCWQFASWVAVHAASAHMGRVSGLLASSAGGCLPLVLCMQMLPSLLPDYRLIVAWLIRLDNELPRDARQSVACAGSVLDLSSHGGERSSDPGEIS